MAKFLGMSWLKWNIHGRLLIYFLLESYRIIAFGKITNIRLADTDEPYIGKVEIYPTSCSSCSSDNWYGVCHDGNANIPAWNREAATAACKQLGYEAGWNRSETGLTEYYSIDGVSCTNQSASLAECTSDGTDHCGCSTLPNLIPFARCPDHFKKEQAAAECFNYTDVSLHLQNVGSNKTKLGIVYRGQQYDVCFHGASKDWSMHEAHVACKQLGYSQGALSTSPATTHPAGSFADFSCNGDRTETSSIKTKTSEDFSTGPIVTDRADGTEASSINSMKKVDFSTRAAGALLTHDTGKEEIRTQQQGDTGLIVGITIGIISLLLLIIVAVLCHMKYRRKTLLKRPTQSQDQQHASTTHPNNVYEAGSAEYAEVQDRVQNPNTDYAYAYSHVRNVHVSSAQPVTDTTRITNQSETNNQEGWADNTAYNVADGLTNHNADGVVLRPSNLLTQNQTDETEGWAENDAYERRSDDATDSRSRIDEGGQENTVYVQN